MQGKKYQEEMEKAISLQLLKMLLRKKYINQPTYAKVIKVYMRKEVA